MDKKKIYAAALLAVVINILGSNCFAGSGGWEGNNDYSTGSGSRNGTGSAGAHAYHWYHFNFLDIEGLDNHLPVQITPEWTSSKIPVVDKQCASKDVGFWILALGTDGAKINNNDVSGANPAVMAPWYTNETGNAGDANNPINGNFYINTKIGSTDAGCWMMGYKYDCSTPGTAHYWRGVFAPYDTLSINNVPEGNISYGNDIPVAEQMLYTKDNNNVYVGVYKNDRIAKNSEEITSSYEKFLKRTGQTVESNIRQQMVNNKVWAFCSYENDESTNLASKTKITVTGDSDDGSKSKTSDDWNSGGTNNEVLVLRGSEKITLSAKYLPKRDNAKFATNTVKDSVVSKFSIMPTASGMPSSQANNLPSFGIGVGDEENLIAWQNGNSGDLLVSNLAQGTEYTICAKTEIPKTLTSDGTTTTASADKVSSSACVKVKYEPNVAEIDSETKVMVSGVDHSSGKDSSGEYDHGLVDYGVNALTAKWSYNLSSNARCKLANFNGKVCNPASDSINDKFTVPYQLFGDIDNANDKSVDLTSPDYWSGLSGDAKTVTYSLLPGESLQKTQSLNHYAGVRQDGSKANSGTIRENSTMTLKATAKNAVCKINDQEFGLSNPINYGRLTVTKNASSTTTYGDNSSAGWNNSIWLRPEDKVVLGYEACLGAQIKKDKDGGKAWDVTLDSSDIITLGVGTTSDLLDNSHYKITGNAVDKDGTMGKSIAANEVIGDTVTKHLAAEYQFAGVKSREAEVGNLGRAINNDFVIRTDGTARATFKIPYNYILEPKINPGSKDVITVGDSNAFTLSISNHDTRVNKQVQDTAYHTNVKPGTRASYLVFAASTASTTEGLLQSLDGKFVYGDKTGDIQSALSGLDIQNAESGSIGLNADGSANKAVKVNSDKAIDGYNKICAAVAVYPADSHNMQGEKDIDNDSQYDALTDNFGAAYTRISVSCKTVGKYPTASVEGSGIATSEEVKGSYTTYNGRNFGSWSEYGLVANSVTDFASGASVAYAISNPQTTPNRESDPNSAGLKDGDLDSLQTHGNLDKDNVGLRDTSESSIYYSQARTFVDAVKSSFFAEEATNVFNLEQVNDSNIYVNKNHDKNITIGEAEAQKINNDVPSGSIVIIYTSGNISISNKIEKLNATLIAEDTIDTCAENGQGGDNGQLLDDCYNQLVVNGVVYSGNAIKLDRVYGGGSTSGMNLDAQTLVQRAEVFNYNPDYIKSIYQYTLKAQPLTTTYIEELSTRY